jgi:hypothetical protein
MLSELTLEQLQKLSTGRLLAYKRRVFHYLALPVEDWVYAGGGCSCEECVGIRAEEKKWNTIHENIKKVLSTREHVEKKNSTRKKINEK